MPRTGRRKDSPDGGDGDVHGLSDAAWREAELDDLVSHCLEAHAVIMRQGTPAMRRLIELLLFEVGSEFGRGDKDRASPSDLD
jgi:hypothetical protein